MSRRVSTATVARRVAQAVAVAPVAFRAPPTREVRFDQVLEGVTFNAQACVEQTTNSLNQWAEMFKAHPAYELAWSANIFRAAAELKVAQGILEFVKNKGNQDPYSAPSSERIVKAIYETVKREVFQGATSPPRSTSPTANEMEAQTTAAYATLLRSLDSKLEFRDLKI
jgi:hypothetical protein